MKPIALLCLLSFAACVTGPAPIPGVPEIPPWRAVADHCVVDKAAGEQCCALPYFRIEAKRCVQHFRAARHFSHDLDECRAERALDGDVADSRLADCDAKLRSPWRSPWLWGGIMLVLGGAIGVGAGVGGR
jgi:hypothetical protein